MQQPLGEERRVVPFAAPAGRMRRRVVEEGAGRGAILLFTGVRYEKIGSPVPPDTGPGEMAAIPGPQRGS